VSVDTHQTTLHPSGKRTDVVWGLGTLHCTNYRRSQNKGYINYTRIAPQDHSYAYDNSAYQDPPAHKKQKEADGAYKHRKVCVCVQGSGSQTLLGLANNSLTATELALTKRYAECCVL
jgi:hypothetical protein